ncbi:glycosyltransferase [Zobellia roscoffensis]|uniref:glycosyltransferase n=1 Tax=Zobellia roscoffensis TaxID=2779508 RepID=UPI00188BA18D|nr:glycosyltransferase [Zobellia roscoffensis]
MEEKFKHIIFLGESRFPYGLASVQRMLLMSKALVYTGAKVTVVCRKGGWKQNQYPDFEPKGNFEGVNYIYTSESTFKPKGFVNRNIQKLKGLWGEYQFIKAAVKTRGVNMAIVSERKNIHILRYYFYSRFFNFPIVVNLVEMASSVQNKVSFFRRINYHILDMWTLKLFSGALPISDVLLKHYQTIVPSKPTLKIPILCDYIKFDIPKVTEKPYFLYCGSINYMEIINFILECYKKLNIEKASMYMIVSGGSAKKTQELQDKINSQFEGNPVKLFTNIPYNELIHLYNNAIGLLIPLRPTLQDTSRFPHKIGEYLASANPVITTNVGEIKSYFVDKETALVAKCYDVSDFSESMRYVLDYPIKAKEIGLKGQKLGLRNFDYKIHGERLMTFMNDYF